MNLLSHSRIAMKKFIALASILTSLCTGLSMAAEDDGWLTCKDGLKVHKGASCENHGGVQIAAIKSTSTVIPIKTTRIDTKQGLAPTAKAKTPKSKAASSARPRTVSRSTRNPTAKCLDGALYFSRERRGACASHGGVDKWYGW
jgi:hypothetical protein